jgi:hypothetical protein
MSRHLNNEQECKTGHVKGRVLVGGRELRKRVKEDEYSCIFYTSMIMGH